MKKGFYFSVELLFSFLLILLAFFFLFFFLSEKITSEKKESESLKLYLNTIKFLDVVVKTNDVNFGAAIPDIQLKRVKSNNLSLERLKSLNFDFFANSDFKISFFRVTFKDGNSFYLFNDSNRKQDNCIIIERFALVENKKALLSLKNCLSDSNEFKGIR